VSLVNSETGQAQLIQVLLDDLKLCTPNGSTGRLTASGAF
jgi:hypothetical protein